jgi:hypothetical protein
VRRSEAKRFVVHGDRTDAVRDLAEQRRAAVRAVLLELAPAGSAAKAVAGCFAPRAVTMPWVFRDRRAARREVGLRRLASFEATAAS